MGAETRMLTVICEAVLESFLERDLAKLGVRGYTISDARGAGRHGKRSGAWSKEGNIRVDILCERLLMEQVVSYLRTEYAKDYAIIMFSVAAETHF